MNKIGWRQDRLGWSCGFQLEMTESLFKEKREKHHCNSNNSDGGTSTCTIRLSISGSIINYSTTHNTHAHRPSKLCVCSPASHFKICYPPHQVLGNLRISLYEIISLITLWSYSWVYTHTHTHIHLIELIQYIDILNILDIHTRFVSSAQLAIDSSQQASKSLCKYINDRLLARQDVRHSIG